MKNYFNIRFITLSACLLLAGLCGCEEPENNPPDPPKPPVENAVYHQGVEAWIVPQNDPYALDNFQQAYANLIGQGLTRAGEPSELTATHYALKIFPRNEDEQWEIELIEGVEVSYIPFTYVGLSEGESKDLETTTRADARPLFPDTNPYVVTDNEIEQTVDSLPPEEKISQVMPIVYAVWPVDKPLPDNLDYEIDYDIFLPPGEQTRSASAFSESTLQLLEDEAIRLALGHVTPRAAATRAGTVLSGEFQTVDNLQNIRVPIQGIKVKFHLGSNIAETSADETGNFSISSASIPTEASWEIIFQSSKWKVTRENTTIPKNFFQGDVYQAAFWSDPNTEVRPAVQLSDATIINSLYYYYNAAHNLSTWDVPGGIRVIAHNDANPAYNGLFTYSSSNNCYITIYRNNIDDRSFLAGTVFHELGHFVQFKERGGYSQMKTVHKLLQESFASYVGWYLTDRYYQDLGYKRGLNEDISGQDRQSWRQTRNGAMGYYSPLFVDLVDEYNQSSINNTYNNDQVKGLSYVTIMQIAKESTDWESCKSILRAATSLQGNLDTFFQPYDYWFTNNN